MTSTDDLDRTRWMALYVLCVGVLMIVLDATIVNVALPSIQDDLGFSQSNLAWVVNAYLIAFGGLLLLAGRLGDLIGQPARLPRSASPIFTAASALCAIAQSQEMLIGARFIQGVGGALTSAVVLGMIVTMFPEPRDQAKAIGVYGFVASAGGSIGLLAGGVLTDLDQLALDLLHQHADRHRHRVLRAAADRARPRRSACAHGADIPGAVLLTGGLMLGVYTILQVSRAGLGLEPHARPRRDRRRRCWPRSWSARRASTNPLMPLRLFRSRNVTGANLVHGAARGRHVRHVLPRRAVPAAGPRLRRRSRSGSRSCPRRS